MSNWKFYLSLSKPILNNTKKVVYPNLIRFLQSQEKLDNSKVLFDVLFIESSSDEEATWFTFKLYAILCN